MNLGSSRLPPLFCKSIRMLALPLLTFFAICLSVQSYQIQGSSMRNSLQDRQMILINLLTYRFRTPRRREIIVFHKPDEPDIDLIKRVIGIPGDTVKLDAAGVWTNGIKLNEPYITQSFNYNANTWEVSSHEYFVMGDNRSESEDSRQFGCVSEHLIVGKAAFIYWPVGQWRRAV